MSSYVELQMEQGATFSYALSIKDNNGSPVDLTSLTISSQMRKSYYSANSVALTCTSAVPNTGNITISMTSANTANRDVAKYVFDVRLVDVAASTQTRVIEGIIQVTPGVTR